jgi:DNA repair protein RadC
MKALREIPAEDRPRERLLAVGANSLKTSELIAILLRTGTPGASAVAVGEQLLDKFGSLENLSRASVQELAQIKGIGQAKAIELKAAFTLGARLSRSTAESRAMDHPQAIYDLLGEEMRLLGHECVRVILLNSKLRLLAVEEITRGTLNESLFHAREAFRPAIARGAYGLVLVHNHPSGDATPSAADQRVTEQMKDAARLLDIRLLDHVIIGAPQTGKGLAYFSFKEHGYL